MDLKQLWTTLWKWSWLVIACTAISAGTSYIGVRNMPAIYQATVTVRIGQTLDKANPSPADFYASDQLAQTYLDLVRRRPIMEGVAQALGLQFVPGGASARRVTGTQLLEISYSDVDPARAQAIANETANQLILQSPRSSDANTRDQEFVLAQLDDLKAKIDDTKAKIETEQANLDAANSARAIQQYQSNIAALQQKLNSYQNTYATMRYNLPGSNSNYISLVEPAQLPRTPLNSGKLNTILLAAAIGAGLAIAAAFLLEYLDDTVKTPDDVERIAGVTTLGAISQIEEIKEPTDGLVVHAYPKSQIAEAYRVLRTNLQFSAVGSQAAVFMVTSSNAGEGKTTTLGNLGVALAQAGKNTILVDTDLRRPALHKLFGLPNSIGLTSMLLDDRLPLQDALTPTEVPNLRLLCSGPRPPNPAELLEHPRMDQIIAALKAEADVVLFDSPPVLAVADSTILAQKIHGVLLVVEMGRTRTEIVRRAVGVLKQVNAKLLGVVMNKINRARGGYYYYYYYQNYYYYDSGDGEQRAGKHRRHRAWWQRLLPAAWTGGQK
jgi:non-specific protein-tyrosine kinase